MSKLISTVFLVFCAISSIASQEIRLNCNFVMIQFSYGCLVDRVNLPTANENSNIVIGGQHQPGKTNADVKRVSVEFSEISFVVNQLFTTFPNVNDLYIHLTTLKKFHLGAFNNARNLENLSIKFNNDLREISARAFVGAQSLVKLNLARNQLESIDAAAFDGLKSLTTLDLKWNNLQQLPGTVFSVLPALQNIYLTDNKLVKLEGGLFSSNLELLEILIHSNQINAIGQNFLVGLTKLQVFSANNNICVDRAWVIGGSTTIETVRQALAKCFNNYV
jgi:Leucine-rich repeat (LRR) protein